MVNQLFLWAIFNSKLLPEAKLRTVKAWHRSFGTQHRVWLGARVGRVGWALATSEMTMGYCLVVWNTHFIFPYNGNNHPN